MKKILEPRFYYRIEKITHRPKEEGIISVVAEIREKKLTLARLLATKRFLEEKSSLGGAYSPSSYSTYKPARGKGYNLSLLFVDAVEEEIYLVESTMGAIIDAVDEQRKDEKSIFQKLGFNFPQEIDMTS